MHKLGVGKINGRQNCLAAEHKTEQQEIKVELLRVNREVESSDPSMKFL